MIINIFLQKQMVSKLFALSALEGFPLVNLVWPVDCCQNFSVSLLNICRPICLFINAYLATDLSQLVRTSAIETETFV